MLKIERCYTKKEAAALLGLSVRSVERRMEAGQLERWNEANRTVIPESSIVAYQQMIRHAPRPKAPASTGARS